MTRVRRKFSQEFKEEAVSLVVEQGYSFAEAGRNLGIGGNLIARWKRRFEEARGFAASDRLGPEQQRIRELEAENRRLRMEREILKKATAFFAKESP